MRSQPASKQELFRQRVYKFYLENKEKGKPFIVQHFEKEKVSKRSIYFILERADNNLGWKRERGSGPRAVKMNQKKIDRLTEMFDNKCGISQRQAARKFQCSQSYISKTLKHKTKIVKRKKREYRNAQTRKKRLRK